MLGIGGALVLGLLIRGSPLVAFLAAMLLATIAAAWERRDSAALLLAALLAATGFALGIFVEFFTLQGDIGRMNTVFKFYLQVWVMWGLVSAVALAWALERILGRRTAPAAVAPPARPAAIGRGLLYENPVATGTGDGEAADWAVVHGPEAPQAPQAEARDQRRAERMGERRERRLDAGARSRAGAGERAPRPWWQWAWLAMAGGLGLAALAYPLGATPARLADRFNPLPPTLDGMAYMKYATFLDAGSEVTAAHPGGVTIRLADDYQAINWLLANVQGSPVVLEASVPEYRWGARVAKYTGLPAVLGWRWHQVQQRGTYGPMVDQRLRDVQTMFNEPSVQRVRPLLEKYRVRYIYVGDLERAYYAAGGLAKFSQQPDTFRPVYQQGGVTIYEVVGATTNTGR